VANILDTLFQWAAEQPVLNNTTVQIAIATNDTINNLVSYAQGTLTYNPAKREGFVFSIPAFASAPNGVQQFFSDRSFDPDETDLLTVRINSLGYTIEIASSKWGFDYTVSPSFDGQTGVIYGAIGQTFITISLCNQASYGSPG
jgi:hypothetical protein